MYDVILADPPWSFKTWSDKGKDRSPEKYYSVLSTEAICRLDIPTAENAVLFLWATFPMLKAAFEVIDAWGFEYKTLAWIWVKTNQNGHGGWFTGMGYYTRANSEPCLLATKGKILKVQDHSVRALIVSPVQEHSRKPDEQYPKIEKLYPNMRYLELFARRQRPGWDVFGNEVENSITISLKDCAQNKCS